MFSETKVLVVEDEIVIAEDIADWVTAAGGKVIGPAQTVARALELIGTTPVDAAILDSRLPDRDVTPVARLLMARNVPVIVYSGMGLPDELAAAYPNIPLILKPAPTAGVVKRLVTLFREQMRPPMTEAEEVEFHIIRLFVDDRLRTGRSVYLGGALIGVLIPVTADEQGDGGAGGWYLEAGFGPCGPMNVSTPPTFADLDQAAAWFLSNLTVDEQTDPTLTGGWDRKRQGSPSKA